MKQLSLGLVLLVLGVSSVGCSKGACESSGTCFNANNSFECDADGMKFHAGKECTDVGYTCDASGQCKKK